jgi:hypothetical protein
MGKKNRKKNKNRNRHNNNHQNHFHHNEHHNTPPAIDHIYEAEQIEKPNTGKRNILTMIIVIALAIILTLVILFSTGLMKADKVSFLPFTADLSNSVEADFGNDISDQITDQPADSSDSTAESDSSSADTAASDLPAGLNVSYSVRLPMLLGDFYDFEVEGEKIGCDTIWWVDVPVAPTVTPLNATYLTLFNWDQELDFHVGNYAAKQSNLTFDYAEIQNRVAKVYLNGSVDETVGECDEGRLEVQITQASLQFDTVDDVEIYLNGKRY